MYSDRRLGYLVANCPLVLSCDLLLPKLKLSHSYERILVGVRRNISPERFKSLMALFFDAGIDPLQILRQNEEKSSRIVSIDSHLEGIYGREKSSIAKKRWLLGITLYRYGGYTHFLRDLAHVMELMLGIPVRFDRGDGEILLNESIIKAIDSSTSFLSELAYYLFKLDMLYKNEFTPSIIGELLDFLEITGDFGGEVGNNQKINRALRVIKLRLNLTVAEATEFISEFNRGTNNKDDDVLYSCMREMEERGDEDIESHEKNLVRR